jgi:DegV family protein with EDD domain
MSSVKVVTDSTAYLPAELCSERGITQVSLYYSLDGAAPQRELDMDAYGRFYPELEAAEDVARTSPPSEDDFVNAYEPLLADGSSVVSVHISSGLSDTCMHARAAAERLKAAGKGGDRIRVVDSAGTSSMFALAVLATAAAAARGDLEATVARADEARHESQLRFLVDTLEYLRRGGRIGTAAAWLGSALDIKPILTIESEIKAVERARTRQRGIDQLVAWARTQAAGGADAWLIQHSAAPEDAKAMAARLSEVFRRPPETISELGPVVGTHTGAGTLALGTLPSRLLD